MTGLSWVYLALGRNADALRLSRQAADSLSIEKDAMAGPFFQIGVAQIEARGGAPEEAIERLRRLLSMPAGQVVSIARLKIDPSGIRSVVVPISSSCSQARSRSDLTSNSACEIWDPLRPIPFSKTLRGKAAVNLHRFFAELISRTSAARFSSQLLCLHLSGAILTRPNARFRHGLAVADLVSR